MIKVCKLKRDFLGVFVSWIITIVLISVLLDPIGDLQLGSLSLGFDIVVFLNVNLPCEEIEGRLILRLFRLIRPEVLDLALLYALFQSHDSSFVILLRF